MLTVRGVFVRVMVSDANSAIVGVHIRHEGKQSGIIEMMGEAVGTREWLFFWELIDWPLRF
jgi:hypothetical protein